MHYLKLAKHLFNTNRELVKKSAIRDCHCLGLHSFLLNEKPRIRLFIADDTSELHHSAGYTSPVPIHSHKYDDMFQVINGKVIHYLYEIDKQRGDVYNKWLYPRIKDGDNPPMYAGHEHLVQTDIIQKKVFVMRAETLHSVRLKGNNVMWLVTELTENKGFQPVGYTHSNHKLKARKELYKPFNDAIGYVAEKLINVWDGEDD